MTELAEGEVQVWRVDLATEAGRGVLEGCYAALSVEEKAVAERKRAGLPREEFVAGRGMLRRLLGIAPEVELEIGEHGKPAWGEIFFNVSHSRGLVLVALTRTGAVGVDVEAMKPEVEAVEVARASFAPGDAERVAAARTEAEKLDEFYRMWTVREAMAKADGRGISLEMDEIGALAGGGKEVRVEMPSVGEGIRGSVFFVNGIIAHPLYRAALATSVAGVAMRLYDFAR